MVRVTDHHAHDLGSIPVWSIFLRNILSLNSSDWTEIMKKIEWKIGNVAGPDGGIPEL